MQIVVRPGVQFCAFDKEEFRNCLQTCLCGDEKRRISFRVLDVYVNSSLEEHFYYFDVI